jgi:SAM-dependent methyltransferase
VAFEVAADRYDAYMGRWSRLLAPQLADLAGVEAPARVIDVGCGTGTLTAELVGRVGAARVAAVDPSAAFVAAMRERFPGVDVRQAGADDLPFDDDAFDASLAQLVVHFMPDPVAGLREMRRVTRPGGVVAACVWDFGSGRGPLDAFWDAAHELRPDVEDEMGRPGTQPGQLASLFTAAGLREVRDPALEVVLPVPTFDAFWEPFLHGVGPTGTFIASLDEADRARLRELVRHRVGDGPLELSGRAWAARGEA